jgi:hypothetical protein
MAGPRRAPPAMPRERSRKGFANPLLGGVLTALPPGSLVRCRPRAVGLGLACYDITTAAALACGLKRTPKRTPKELKRV